MSQRSVSRRTIGLTVLVGVALAGALLVHANQSSAVQGPALVRGNAVGEWRYWGADAYSTRYSALDQINARNFDSLQVAWTWSAESFGSDEYYRTTPLYATGSDGKGRLFTVATTRRIAVAIDPANGETLWSFRLNEGIRWQKAPRQFAGRGLAYWTDGRGTERAIVVTPGYHLASLDAKTGIPDPKFGKNGVVDLDEGLGFTLVPLAVDDNGSLKVSDEFTARVARPGETWNAATGTGADGTMGIDPKEGEIAASSPPIVVNDVIIVGNSAIHGYYPVKNHNIPGTVRGFDVHTGKQLWLFHLIPQPGEFGDTSWHNGSKTGSPGVGKNDAYGVFSGDPELGMVYIEVGMPLSDEYGGLRPGSNLFGNSIVALDVKSGKMKWFFQMTHHDAWDWDASMSPNLMDVTVNGTPRKIVAQTTKNGWVYTFDRITGQPIWPMPETPVPASEVPGEELSPTQPIPTKPPPYAWQGMGELIDYTPALKDSALKLASRGGACFTGPYYLPHTGPAELNLKHTCTYIAPGASGGVNVDGGAAADPETGFLYVGAISSAGGGGGASSVAINPCSEFPFEQGTSSCGSSGYINGAYKLKLDSADGREAMRQLALRGPQGAAMAAGVAKVLAAPRAAGAAGGAGGRGGGGGGGGAAAAPLTIGGISIFKPGRFGGITAYDMNKGDKAWWSANGGAPDRPAPVPTDPTMFRGVTLPTLPGQGIGGQAEVITTKTLLIYGPGRSGGASAGIYAVDKATGKQLGMVKTATANSAVPMTFMHQGRQYIVFATTVDGFEALQALRLPVACTGRSGCPTTRPAAAGAGGGGAAAAPAAAPAPAPAAAAPAAGGAGGRGGRGGGGRGGAP